MVAAQTIQAVQAWVDERSSLGEQIGGSLAIEASWGVNMRIPLDAETARDLSRDLSAYPDHPLRGRQQQVRDAAEKGIDSRRFLVAGNGRWRIAKDERGQDPTNWHSGGFDGDSWMWYKTEVTLVNASQPPKGRDYPDLRFEYLSDVLGFLTGGLAELPPLTRRWKVTDYSGSKWKAIATVGEPPVTYTAEGSWDAAAGRGVVHSVTSPGTRAEYSDWRDRDGFWTAGRITLVSDSGYRWIHVLKDITTPTKDRVVAVAQTPTPGKPDPLLAESSSGESVSAAAITTPLSLVDLRSGEPTAVIHSPDGLTQVPVEETPQVKARRQLRWAGWAIGVSLAILICAVWMRTNRWKVTVQRTKEHA
ncbi:MAG: hypothetical protein HUU18_08625 [Phycisphaerales bacterium]|nr:hypothetical protein [Phycisphaerales bacterium]